jgi:type I site-specific restriction-modification system R (restriction) subunit
MAWLIEAVAKMALNFFCAVVALCFSMINEKADYQQDPDLKKQALIEIINDYNTLFNANHSIAQFDSYYQDIQTRIKDQKYTNKDLPHSKKLDIVIVVDMLLTGFDYWTMSLLPCAGGEKTQAMFKTW